MPQNEIENKNQNPSNVRTDGSVCGKGGGMMTDRSMPDHPTISIVIPVHNGGEKFRQCLESVSCLQPPPLEIVIVADGDTDGSADMASQFNVRVVRLPHRAGPARARNEGAARAHGEILLFIDADVAVPPDLLHRAAQGFNAAPHTAAIIGSYDCEPAAEGVISQYKNLMHHHVHQQSDEEAATFWGACGVIRREVFLAMGGFDERYRRPCVEDIDLGYRLRAAGHVIRLHKTLQVKHLKRWTFLSLLRSDIFDRALPWTELIMRYRLFRSDLNLRHSDRLSVAAMYALLLATPLVAWSPFLLVIPGSLAFLLLALNIRLYRFFIVRRGIVFGLAAVPLHWLSFIYSGMAFMVGAVRHGLVSRLIAISSSQPHLSDQISVPGAPEPVIPRLGNNRGGGA
jgi:GT2 family glycosyltransferase